MEIIGDIIGFWLVSGLFVSYLTKK